MRVRALAIASEYGNAVGTVELECTPHGLAVAYLSVGSFREDYAPGALVQDVEILVPWPKMLETRVDRDRVCIAFDPSCSPHHRLALTGFGTGDVPDPRELYKQRLLLRVATWAGAAVLASLLSVGASRLYPEATVGTVLALGGLVAVIILVIGFMADQRLTQGGVEGEQAQRLFVSQLSSYAPELTHVRQPSDAPPKPIKIPDLTGLLPRTTFAITVALSATLLAALLVGRWAIVGADPAHSDIAALEPMPRVEPPEPPQLERTESDAPQDLLPSQPAPAATPAAVPPAPAESRGEVVTASTPKDVGPCTCVRGDSALFERPIPKLSILVLGTELIRRSTHDRLAVDIGVVNNSDREMSDISLDVSFYERDRTPNAERHFSTTRALFFEGPLGAGQSIKWSTEARGNEFDLENPVESDIGPGGDGAAALSFFHELLLANHRPVRLHAAMMLTYLGDPGAREAVLSLKEALREDEAPYLNRLLTALGPVRTCELDVRGTGATRTVGVCVFNAALERRDSLGLKVRALETQLSPSYPIGPPPVIAAEQDFRLAGSLEPKHGRRLELTWTDPVLAKDPPTFETVADRFDLLR